MPIFEDGDIPHMRELMNEDAKNSFLAKKERIRKAREAEIAELEKMLIDGPSEEPGEVDRP